jgi:enoyl-CoA hydratase/carnithine racemase
VSSESGTVGCTRDGPTATVTLDAPARLNAISASMWRELRRLFEALAADGGLHCILMRGADGNFAAGADIEEFVDIRHDRPSGRHYHLEIVAPALEAIRRTPQTVIAAIEGMCVGGGLEIALACDLRLASEEARLGMPVGRLGFPLALPELVPLLELVGPGVASELLLGGRLFDAQEARAKGLVQHVVPRDHLHREVQQWTRGVLAGSPLAARLNKSQIRGLMDRGLRYSAAELQASFGFLDSDDYKEGVAAFLGKRRPVFTGK